MNESNHSNLVMNSEHCESNCEIEEESSIKAERVSIEDIHLKQRTPSTDSADQIKLSEQLANLSVHHVDDSMFEFDVADIPKHKSRLDRGQIHSNVRVSHVDEYLSCVYVMLDEDWTNATRMLDDHFQQTALDKQPLINVLSFKIGKHYMCKSQSSWFRCRLLTRPNDENLVSVHLIDWGMERKVLANDVREMPQSLTCQPICCVKCRLSGVSTGSPIDVTTLALCHQLLNRHVYEMRVLSSDSIVLYHDSENINDEILSLLNQNLNLIKETYLEDEFRHQVILNIGDEHWAVLASYRGGDNQNSDFYILLSDKTTKDVDKALAAINCHQYNVKEPRSIHSLCVKPRMMVIAPWKNDHEGTLGYYRAWIRSVQGDLCRIVYVDYGNECDIERSKLLFCPLSASCLPWLAIRVCFQQHLSRQEFQRFWNRTEAHWVKMKVLRIHNTHYTIQLFIDYTSVILTEDRNNLSHLKDKVIDDMKIDWNRFTPQRSFSSTLQEIQKKLNKLCQQFDENEKKNDERYSKLLEELQSGQ